MNGLLDTNVALYRALRSLFIILGLSCCSSVSPASAADLPDFSTGWMLIPGKYKAEDQNDHLPDKFSVSPLTETVECRDGSIIHLRSIKISDTQPLRLEVIDNPDGSKTLADAMRASGAIAGVNGNYFRADRSPVGLVISAGKTVHPLENAKLLTGILAVSGQSIHIYRTAEFPAEKKWDAALQCGPFLIDQYKIVPGLDDTRRAFRTAVIIDAAPSGIEVDIAHTARLVVCEPVTLAEFASILARRLMTGTHSIDRALNLDGGPSRDVGISPSGTGGNWKSGYERPRLPRGSSG
jgi:hypothetical protein